MQSPNLGPEGVWKAGGIAGFVGILAGIFLFCWFIGWLISHLHWI